MKSLTARSATGQRTVTWGALHGVKPPETSIPTGLPVALCRFFRAAWTSEISSCPVFPTQTRPHTPQRTLSGVSFHPYCRVAKLCHPSAIARYTASSEALPIQERPSDLSDAPDTRKIRHILLHRHRQSWPTPGALALLSPDIAQLLYPTILGVLREPGPRHVLPQKRWA